MLFLTISINIDVSTGNNRNNYWIAGHLKEKGKTQSFKK